MARKKKLDHHALMKATEGLLLEKGYNAFTFGLLAERLSVGRSTIYEYYPNKDELIIAYLHGFAYERVKESQDIMQIEDIQAKFREFIRVFLKYSHIQLVIKMLEQMEEKGAYSNKIQVVREVSKEIYSDSLLLIQQAKEAGMIKKEANTVFISYVIFNLIQIPNFRNQTEEERLEEIMDFILNGVSCK
ncbi:TetR/AcrR family transcriptional regulator [Bacillus testis]|uniref:TetR/AcrR family transcriptional regulator n=1 Tax=Bacillus testis TaxID=1622072 RepID=UPI00067F0B4C|nr:TetR/AcrR family transcriptional regulator [Bacillus testis]